MQIELYEEKVVSLLKPEIANGNFMSKVGYLLGKMSSEVGETWGEFCKKSFHVKQVPPEKFKDELGDISWYLVNLLHLLPEDLKKSIFTVLGNNGSVVKNDDAIMASFMEMTSYIGEICKLWSVGKLASEPEMVNAYQLLFKYAISYRDTIHIMGFELEDILDRNIAKLSARHGSSYNASFYQTPAQVT